VWIADNGKLGYTMQPFHEVEEMNPLQLDGVPPFKFGSINSDEEGNLWIGTEIGLVKQNPESKETILYGYDRGLQGYDFSSNANYRGPSGKLYFWGNGGINIFDPLEIKENPFPPQMAVRELRLDDVSVTKHYYSSDTNLYLNPIIINPDVTVISIDIAPIHFGLAKPNDYQFQLIGFDENWRTGHGEITYTNLAPGNYSLKVKGKNLDGIWSDEMTMLSFNVLPPWWRTRWAYFGYILLFGFVLYGLARWQKARITRKEKEKSLQKELAQAKEIEKAYSELKATQTQLIHSEKMASLGELTAGIAHEIQNPLNFVNNFSEISSEMTDEIEEELEDGEIIEARKILKDLKSNLDKITHHGQRADNIVKNMLMHSRSQSGEKMPVDINAMAEEYIRLAYHGMRAKHSEFNADLKVFLDEKIPIMDLVPQDISRVLLNLITNALQAVYEKKKTLENGYVPTVALGTKYVQNESSKLVEITISDNGPGIPMELEEKIFQPFFTTKPTGEGTGLGLSLAYDIVKANGGEILVDSDSMTGSIFKIILPVK
jgi:signal transduction histidine kinase